MSMMYFKDFATFNECIDDSKSFVISIALYARGGETKGRDMFSSPIPNTQETRGAVMTAIAMTAPEYREPFCLWNGRSLVVIPADSIESIRLEFDLPRR